MIDAAERAEPLLAPLREAQDRLSAATAALRRRVTELEQAPIWRRRSAARAVTDAEALVAEGREVVDALERRARPQVEQLQAAEERRRVADREARSLRLAERLADLEFRPAKVVGRGAEIDLPGR